MKKPTLTKRQIELMSMMGFGLTTKDIAVAWRRSPKTVEKHRDKLMKSMNFYSFGDIIRTAIAFGLSPL